MERIAAVQARIATIEATFASLTARRSVPTPIGGTAGSFEAALSSALRVPAFGVSPTSPAERLAPGEYGRLEPPAELAAYGNGHIPADALAPIGVGQHRLWAPAARAYRQLVSAAAAQGITIGITDSYRDYGAQVRLAEEKGLYEDGGLAAQPGTSNHGWGLAIDLDLDERAQTWIRENGWRFGFVEDVPREPWHWTYRPAA